MRTRIAPGVAVMVAAGLLAGGLKAADIRGLVTDKEGETLPGATVQLIQMPDTTRVAYTLAGDDGDFHFAGVVSGKYYVITSMISMEDGIREVEVKNPEENIDLGKITMGDNAIALGEVVVTAIKAAVVARQDTIEFNAGSYHTGVNSTVNDLLKKLPGVEVGSDGSITSNGKTVTKILVDGKEFFGEDTEMATKNLPSSMVDKVQVVDRKSDLARLTGVDDGEEETVINLTVKKDMQNGWFGNVSGGYGTDNRYQGSFVVNHFFNGNQITILGGLNNINENGFGDRGRGRFRSFGGNNGISTAQRFGVNFNVGKEEKIRVGGNVMYAHNDRKSESKTATQYLFPDSVSYQDSKGSMRDQGHNIFSDFRVQWKPDDNNTFDFRPRFSINLRDSESDQATELRSGGQTKVNRNTSMQTNHGNGIEAGGNLIYNHNFASRPGRSFSVQGQYQFSNTRQKSTTWSDIVYYLMQDDSEELYRFIDNRTWSNTVDGRLTWTEPLGDVKRGNFLTFAYRIKYQWNNADKYTYNIPHEEVGEDFEPEDFKDVPAGAVADNGLSNRYRNKFLSQELQVGYKKVSKTLNLDAGLLFSPSSSKSENLIDANRSVPERWVWNVSPYANIRYKFGSNSSFRANYRARTSLPSMTQLQPVEDVSDPLNIVRGNPELKPTFTQNIGFFFNDYNNTSQQSIFAAVHASFALNSVAARTVSNPETGGRITTYSNVDGNLNIFGMGMITRPFTNRKWRFNARLNARFGSTPGYINGDFNRTGNLSLSPSAGITFSCDVFQLSVNPTYTFGNVSNSLPDQHGRQTHAYGFTADASVYLPFGLEFTTDLDFSRTSGYSSGYNSTQWLWNAQLSYSFLKNKSLTAAVRAYDILGQKKNISRSVSPSAIVDSEYNDLTRYVMFSLTWTFNSMSKKAEAASPIGGDMPPGPPGGQGGRPQGPPPGAFRPRF